MLVSMQKQMSIVYASVRVQLTGVPSRRIWSPPRYAEGFLLWFLVATSAPFFPPHCDCACEKAPEPERTVEMILCFEVRNIENESVKCIRPSFQGSKEPGRFSLPANTGSKTALFSGCRDTFPEGDCDVTGSR